jgi:hypothetical protein
MPAINGVKNLMNGAFFQIGTLFVNIPKSYVLALSIAAYSRLIILLLKRLIPGEKTVLPRIFNFQLHK